MLARLCAKHGLPLPHPRHLNAKQQTGSLWEPDKQQQQAARLTQRGGEVARRREDLLQQLKRSSVSRRKQPGTGTAAADVPCASPIAAGAAAAADRELSDSQQQQQLMLLSPARPYTPPSPHCASELHLVDGLQYVHALLGSIKMPSAAPGRAGDSRSGSSDAAGRYAGNAEHPLTFRQQQQQQQQHPEWQEDPWARNWRQQGQQVERLGSIMLQQRLRLPAAADGGQLRTLCSTALANLGLASSGKAGVSTVHWHSSIGRTHPQQMLPLQDALILLCLADSQQQQQRGPQQECFAALHAAVHQHLRPPPGDAIHQRLQPGWHQQQQRQLAQGLCVGPRQLGLRAVAAVAAAQQEWMLDELQPLWQCLHQVGVPWCEKIAYKNIG
jgi:hypothetical protein